jgi:hypothetical protein
LGRHLDAEFRSHVFEHDRDCLDYELIRMSLAVLDYFVLGLAGLPDVKIVLARQAVVPAAVPGSEKISVSLPSSGQLRALNF